VTVSAVCRQLGITRQNYYARRQARQLRQVDAGLVVALVMEERKVQPRLGTRKLHFMLKGILTKAGVRLGRDRFFDVLREQGLLLEPKPAEYPCTTNSHHCLPVFTNRIKGLVVSQPNEVWVGDLTYLRTEAGFLYLALLTDKCSRKVVGYHCGDTLEAGGCLEALKQALAEMPAGATPIHHTDQGTQYCSHEYVDRVKAGGLSMSMTERDHCAENALAERMNGILKSEYGLGVRFRTKAGAHLAVGQAVHLYNTRRPHTALGYQTPQEAHSLAA
jgi:putative transposase